MTDLLFTGNRTFTKRPQLHKRVSRPALYVFFVLFMDNSFFYSYPMAVTMGVDAACFAGPYPANRHNNTAATTEKIATS
jgi:hypothetical protein